MGAAALITYASTDMLVPSAWDPIQHVDTLDGVTLRLGVTMLKVLSLVITVGFNYGNFIV